MSKSVQFIGYQIQTAAEGNTNRRDYPGLAIQKSDIEQRCKIMVDAIDAARRDSNINSLATKIFVAPEFFFRGGVTGVYDVENVSYVSEVLDQTLSSGDYSKWIFVLGSILAVMPGTTDGKKEIMNIAVVRKGGVKVTKTGVDAGDSLLVYKEYVSAIDFLGQNFGDSNAFHGLDATGGRANILGAEHTLAPTSGSYDTGYLGHFDLPNVQEQMRTWTPSVKFRAFILKKFAEGKITAQEKDRLFTPRTYTTSETSLTGLGGGTNFTMGGLNFVLEVCLDHLEKRALGTVNPATVDVHMVSSCGMDPVYQLNKPGGYFFQVDGIAHHSNLVWLISFKPAQPYTRVSSVGEVDMTKLENWRRHLSAGTNLFQKGKGTVYVFPKVDIP